MFDSLEEEARFWDTHDSGEFGAEFEPVDVEFANPLGHVFLLRLDADLLSRLHSAARQSDVDVSTFARGLLSKGLEEGSSESREPTGRGKQRAG
ncbi:MAG: hypothetical protein H0W06_09805 [Chloroflexia bacterium]|nr:hypothetical protein [Chloroflexia bacterium]